MPALRTGAWRIGLIGLVACTEPKEVPRISVGPGPCAAAPARGAGDVFLASLGAQELNRLAAILSELADRLDARVFDVDFADDEPFSDLRQWMAVRQQAWAASEALAAQRWGPADGSFCARVEVSGRASLPAVWPEPGELAAPPRVRFAMYALTEGVRIDKRLSAEQAARCRQHALSADSPLAMLVSNHSNPSAIAGLARRILRRLPPGSGALVLRTILSQLVDQSGQVSLPGVREDEWLAVPRVGANRKEVQQAVAECLSPP